MADIGLIGLGVMGANLALNMAEKGHNVAVYNRTPERTDAFMASAGDLAPKLTPVKSLADLAAAVTAPRPIVIMVKAGSAVDEQAAALAPHLAKGDILIDAGNANFRDTRRREQEWTAKGIDFLGVGVSGGEEGARFGPSLMPGGEIAAWQELKPIWEAIAAKVDAKTGRPLAGAKPGQPVKGGVTCTTYIGENGAGHYVKMVHNGIEYGDMQMICEAYALMQGLLGLKPAEMGAIFSEWNAGALDSFLIEITADILKQKDPATKRKAFVDVVLDTAGQKGTGKWTSTNALDMGVPAPTIAEAVFARCISAIKDERVSASKILKGPKKKYRGSKKALITAIHDALYCSKICSYAQGFQLMRTAQQEFNWKLNFGDIARIWRGGCIIRAAFLQKITEAYERNPNLANLLLDPYFNKTVQKAQENWRKVVALAAECGVAAPTFASALAYYDSYRAARLPANLLQAQRDYFGAHTYERVDQPRGKFFHVDWPEPTRPQIEA
ncbi:MAG: NADP-dependent phosphogluconate dehydrogenase [Opitutaceae bacterium]|nr:NADP-dependent phosphogluconate dehydrogenase [Opitutaceae bacterium]